MIAEISSLIASSKSAYDIAKGISSAYVQMKTDERTTELLRILLSVQADALSVNAIAQKLQEEKYELTQKLMEFEKWSEVEGQHELKEVMPGIRVYIRKGLNEPEIKTVEWACTNCWNDKVKSILQLENENEYVSSYICPRCKYPFKWHKPMKPIQYPNMGSV